MEELQCLNFEHTFFVSMELTNTAKLQYRILWHYAICVAIRNLVIMQNADNGGIF